MEVNLGGLPRIIGLREDHSIADVSCRPFPETKQARDELKVGSDCGLEQRPKIKAIKSSWETLNVRFVLFNISCQKTGSDFAYYLHYIAHMISYDVVGYRKVWFHQVWFRMILWDVWFGMYTCKYHYLFDIDYWEYGAIWIWYMTSALMLCVSLRANVRSWAIYSDECTTGVSAWSR